MGAAHELLRLYWPEGLVPPPIALAGGSLHLIGRSAQQGLQREVLVTSVAAPGAAAAAAEAGGEAVGTLLPAGLPADSPQPSNSLRVAMHPSDASRQPLPIVLPPTLGTLAAGSPSPSTRRAAAAATAAATAGDLLQHQPVHCQVVLYPKAAPPQLVGDGSVPCSSAAPARPHRRRLPARLAARVAAALLAAVLLAHWRGVAYAAGSCGERLARFAAAQLAWSMAAQPAGEALECLWYCFAACHSRSPCPLHPPHFPPTPSCSLQASSSALNTSCCFIPCPSTHPPTHFTPCRHQAAPPAGRASGPRFAAVPHRPARCASWARQPAHGWRQR